MESIVKIVISGSSGYCLAEERYNDKLTITPESITYEYAPLYETPDNCRQKWKYTTNSPAFKMQYMAVEGLMDKVINHEQVRFITDIGEIEFSVTYADKSRWKESFALPGNYFKDLFDTIRVMVPEAESIPKVLLTSDDF